MHLACTRCLSLRSCRRSNLASGSLVHTIFYKLPTRYFFVLHKFKKMRPIKFLLWAEGGRETEENQMLKEEINFRKHRISLGSSVKGLSFAFIMFYTTCVSQCEECFNQHHCHNYFLFAFNSHAYLYPN